MCGIVGYIGYREAYPIIIKGLKRLEYRGYDSAGVALVADGKLSVHKKAGKVSDLETEIGNSAVKGTIGIGHTRWATHGEPNDRNAHPHLSQNEKLAIIHNGIIENYSILKDELMQRGHTFKSDTDTEVLIHLIEDIITNNQVPLEEAVRMALGEVTGAYAIAVMSIDNPDLLIAARKSSPLVIGIGKDEFFIGSDASPIIEYTKNVVYLEDEEIAILNRNNELTIKTIANKAITPYIKALEMKLEALEKGGYDTFMLKEINEQSKSITDSFRGRFNSASNSIQLGGFLEYEQRLLNAKRFIILGCGTSWHAAMVGEYLIEDLARVPVEVEYGSEFRYRNPIITNEDVIIAVSQSGETADTLAAIDIAKQRGALIYGICNVVGSSIARASHTGSYTHAGPEIGVASTKAFTAQLTLLTMFALKLGSLKGTLTKTQTHQLMVALETIPSKVQTIIEQNDYIARIAETFKDASNFLYLGRGYNFPVALEGALKLKEISYIHAEGYPAAEMKHGPIALIDENMPVVVLATNISAHEKIISNIQEIRARKGRVIAIVNQSDTEIEKMSEFVIRIPETEEPLSPMLSVVPLQLLAYHIAILRGCNVDQPRNLAKSVTVE